MNKEWIRAAGMRVIKTMAQTALATVGTTKIIAEVNWSSLLLTTILSGGLSLLTSIVGLPELNEVQDAD